MEAVFTYWYKSELDYNEGKQRLLQLVKITKQSRGNHREWENEFYRQVVKAQKETFSADKLYDNCDHCLEAGSPAPFKLIFKTKHRLFYVCSRVAKTPKYFSIFTNENKGEGEIFPLRPA